MSQAEPQDEVPKPKRRWFQYSLRSLLVMTTLVAIGCGYVRWQIDSYAREWCEEQSALAEIEKLTSPPSRLETERIGPEWFHYIAPRANPAMFDRVVVIRVWGEHDRSDTDALISLLKKLKHLRDVSLLVHDLDDKNWFDEDKLKQTFGDVYTEFQYTE